MANNNKTKIGPTWLDELLEDDWLVVYKHRGRTGLAMKDMWNEVLDR